MGSGRGDGESKKDATGQQNLELKGTERLARLQAKIATGLNEHSVTVEQKDSGASKAKPRALPKPKPRVISQVPIASLLKQSTSPISEPVLSIPGEVDYKMGNEFYMKSRYSSSLSYFEKAANEGYPAAYLRLWQLYGGGR